MKKTVLALLALITVASANCGAWSRYGHQVVVAIAQRHLTDRAKGNISAIMPYDMKIDAGWMDKHRKDSLLRHSGYGHTFSVDSNFKYDPNPRIYKGDVMKALWIADYNLSRYQELSDSLKLLSLRMIIHFVGDMNCPVHNAAPGVRMGGDWYIGGKNKGNFHHLYDAMPNVLYKGMSPDKAAELLDNGITESTIGKWTCGSFTDWLNASANAARAIYDINPVSPEHGDKQLAEHTYEDSRPIIEDRLLAAGYQLAMLLNKYFDK